MSPIPVGEFRCHAALLFVDLCDYTTLAEAMDPEEVATLLGHVRAQVEAVVPRHGGLVSSWHGDGALCVFGAVESSEEDPRHAIDAALAVHALVRGSQPDSSLPAGFRLRVHSGIDCGLIFIRRAAGADTFELIGDAVNTAARLCAHAGRDEVWVTQAALDSFREHFVSDKGEPLALKGKREPVMAFRVQRRSQVKTRYAAGRRRGLSPLVGREEQLSFLRQQLSEAQLGRLRLVSVSGSPGIGKTRLLDELRRSIGDFAQIFAGNCESLPSAVPLQPFIEVLRQLWQIEPGMSQAEVSANVSRVTAGILGEAAPAGLVLAKALEGTLPAEGRDPEGVKQELVEALLELFAALGRSGPTVLLLDDWQWADDVSRQALGGLLRTLQRTPTLIVVASRDLSDPLLASGAAVALAPLQHDESARVIGTILPYSLDLGLTQTIHDRAGGNPLFLEELCRALPTQASSGAEDLIGSRIPSTLRGIIQVRVERLPPAPAQVLRAASVIGNDVPLWLLSHAAEVADLDDAVRALIESDLLHPSGVAGVLRFKHWTTREVVYESVRLPLRRALHGKLAALLEKHGREAARPVVEELHFHLAGSGAFERAAQYAELAGDRSAATCSLDLARLHYRAALDALDRAAPAPEHERRWLAVFDKWAAASLYSPSAEHLGLIHRASEIASRLGDTGGGARADYWLSWFHHALGDQLSAAAFGRRALALAQATGDEKLRVHLALTMGQILAATGEHAEALTQLSSALEARGSQTRGASEAQRPRGYPLAHAYALACKGFVHGDLGRFEEAYACFDEALGLLRGSGHAVEGSCLGLLAMVQMFQGRWEDALDTASRTQATAERVNGPYVFAMSRTVSGYARFMLERSPSAIAELLQSVSWLETRGIRLFISVNYAYLAHALTASGDVARGGEYARRALERATQADRLGEPMAHRVLARICSQEVGGAVTAWQHLQLALSAARARQSLREEALVRLELSRLYEAQQELELARKELEAARGALEQLGMTRLYDQA